MSTQTLSASLCRHLLSGFAQGLGKNQSDPAIDSASVAALALMNEPPAENELVTALDALVKNHPALAPMSEYLFDLAIMQVIANGTDSENEAYFDSPEWMSLEEQTLDRGTELLNVLVYLRDCAAHDVKPTMPDFLNEFLLVDEDEFQDEFYIYEPFIRNQGLAEDGTAEAIVTVGEKMEDQETRDLFAPVMWFFASVGDDDPAALGELIAVSKNASVHGAIFNMLHHYAAVDLE
jgi:hypothetical protein